AEVPTEGYLASPGVEKEGDKVKQVTYPNGSKLDVEYDGKQPTKITQSPSGDKFERQKDGSWKKYKKEESGGYKEVTPDPGKDIKDITITPEGDVIASQSDGSSIRENH